MSNQTRQNPRGNTGAAESKGEQRPADTFDIRQQEIVHQLRQRRESNIFRKLVNFLQSIFDR